MILKNKINELKRNLDNISVALSLLSDENFDTNLKKINAHINTVNNIKAELKSKFAFEELKKYENELSTMAKLIQKKYDNIIEKNKIEQNNISQQLKNIQNQKKLANYR